METLLCTNCQAELKEDFNFCPFCGTETEKPNSTKRKSTHELDEEENSIQFNEVI
ncbi:MAG TPA: zinc-ribbon domain-containing protein [Tenuifilaceae bacterium]|nr:zinc-ribbon domain-containing protein [Tenuifilaceae bacterium]